jgi:hypothetical protein
MEVPQEVDLETIAGTVWTVAPLSKDEKKSLQRRKTAAELRGNIQVIPSIVSERAKLEASS